MASVSRPGCRLGTIAAGAHADLAALHGDPRADIGVLLDRQPCLRPSMKDGVIDKTEL
jgi:imidazolonepropionase-like amidohydrolase